MYYTFARHTSSSLHFLFVEHFNLNGKNDFFSISLCVVIIMIIITWTSRTTYWPLPFFDIICRGVVDVFEMFKHPNGLTSRAYTQILLWDGRVRLLNPILSSSSSSRFPVGSRTHVCTQLSHASPLPFADCSFKVDSHVSERRDSAVWLATAYNVLISNRNRRRFVRRRAVCLSGQDADVFGGRTLWRLLWF